MSAPERPFRVRLERPWGPKEVQFGDILLSTQLPLSEADALLCDFDPTWDLFRAKVPTAWYSGEPLSTPRGSRSSPLALLARLVVRPAQLLHHGHRDPRYRVPAIASRDTLFFADSAVRKDRAVAVVSYAGEPGRRWDELARRNAQVLHPGIDLFGKPAAWAQYRDSRFGRPRTPDNYRGALPDIWGSPQKLALLSQYRVAVCMENSFEPYYFTEKLVDAVMAGCVPIYHAHPTVRETFLGGARWVDPADFDFDPARTLAAAMEQDRAAWSELNREWLNSDAARSTTWAAVSERCCRILRDEAQRRL